MFDTLILNVVNTAKINSFLGLVITGPFKNWRGLLREFVFGNKQEANSKTKKKKEDLDTALDRPNTVMESADTLLRQVSITNNIE